MWNLFEMLDRVAEASLNSGADAAKNLVSP